MPFKSRRPRRRRQFNRKRTMMKKFAKLVDRKIAKNTEQKFVDTNLNAQTVDTSGNIIKFTAIGQGDHDDQRQGDKITLKSYSARFAFYPGDSTNIFRIVFFRWKQQSGSIAPTQAQLMDYGAAAGSNVVLSSYSNDYRGTFEVLKDMSVVVDSVNLPVRIKHVRLNLKKCPKVNYIATSSTDAQNHIYMYIVSDSAAATHPSFNMQARIKYVDS